MHDEIGQSPLLMLVVSEHGEIVKILKEHAIVAVRSENGGSLQHVNVLQASAPS